jgi:hypothetical protein
MNAPADDWAELDHALGEVAASGSVEVPRMANGSRNSPVCIASFAARGKIRWSISGPTNSI